MKMRVKNSKNTFLAEIAEKIHAESAMPNLCVFFAKNFACFAVNEFIK